MNYSKLLRTVKCDDYTESAIGIDKIKAQYNPKRFRFWRQLHEGPKKEVLNMIYSPHFRLLYGDRKPYTKMQELYGRNEEWIKNKINEFIDLSYDILSNGFKRPIMIFKKPLVEN